MAQPKIDSSLTKVQRERQERRERPFGYERVASSLVTDTEIRACGQSRSRFRGGDSLREGKKKLARIIKCDKARQPKQRQRRGFGFGGLSFGRSWAGAGSQQRPRIGSGNTSERVGPIGFESKHTKKLLELAHQLRWARRMEPTKFYRSGPYSPARYDTIVRHTDSLLM